MKKILIFGIFIIAISFVGIINANALVSSTTTTSVNVRSKPTTASAKAVTLKPGIYVGLIDTQKVSGAGCLGGWYKMSWANTTKYICSSYVKVSQTVSAPKVTQHSRTTAAVNVRTSPTTSSKKVVTLGKDIYVGLVSDKKYSGTGCSAGWYQMVYANQIKYICSSYVNIYSNGSSSSGGGSTTTPSTGKQLDAYINSTSLNIRSGAGTGYSSLGEYEFGTQLKLLNTTPTNKSSACSKGWYKVQFTVDKVTKTGYACADFVYKYSDIKATDTTYAQTLRNAGFPETYIPYLTKLHKDHPNWKFVAEKNNLDWNTSITKEAVPPTSLIQTSRTSYRQSNKVYDGTNWYAAHKDVVAVYMDPRNFLTEKHIFMFENLNYDANTSNTAILNSMFGSSYLTKYSNYFLNAAKNNNVSVRHIAARAISETGLNGSDATSGKAFNYNGKSYVAYNFFNIGANSGTNALLNGLIYAAGINGNTAYGVPWNTPEKSINGGAQFIASQYINQGQNTIYYQKFNTSPNRKLDAYTHQYMQNIKAPSIEAVDTYDALKKSNLHNYAYTFKIPVYNNMPSYTVLP